MSSTWQTGATHAVAPQERLVSLDVFRGLTMFLLIAEGAELYQAAHRWAPEGTIWDNVAVQFTHHPWNGLRFWDLIQPFFMFIVGVAMPFSFSKRWSRGDSWGQTFVHVLYRSALLLLLGLMLHCSYRGKLVFELWNVLAQLSVTYLVAFLLMRFPTVLQIGFTFLLLGAIEAAYRYWPVSGYDQPFTPDHNFGSWVDMQLIGHLSRGHWVAVNCVPTTVHTMWGVLAGWLLLSRRSAGKKIGLLVLSGALCVAAGYALDPVTPIIKRICTSSFVIVSGGWALLALAFFFWLVDVVRFRWPFGFTLAFGTNAILIYVFAETAGKKWFNDFVAIFTGGFFAHLGAAPLALITALAVLGLEWAACHWLYRRGVFVRI